MSNKTKKIIKIILISLVILICGALAIYGAMKIMNAKAFGILLLTIHFSLFAKNKSGAFGK